MSSRLEDCRLYAFVDTAYLHGRSPAEVARQLCEGGADIVQLRAKDLPGEQVRVMAAQVAPVLSAAGVHFVVNDYPDIAAEFGAICHLGQEDFFDAGHVHTSEFGVKIGLSTHAPPQAARAVAAAPAYIAIGPVYATGTKPTAKPVTLEYVRWAEANVKIPWFAIGGINLANIADVLEAGARRICVVSAILNAPDVAAACRKFQERLQTAL
jgi:thiamine-phosphate pyrophosphorylase